MGEERTFVPMQLAIIAILLAAFLVLITSYYTNPELTVGFMGELLDAMNLFRGRLSSSLVTLGIEVFLQGTFGLTNLTGQG